jgi:uncharacterized protein (TIGR01244 family)
MKTLSSRTIPALFLAVVSLPAFAAEITARGVPNFHQVNESIYRGGQPGGEGWSSLSKLGVKVVVDLRREDESSASREAQAVQVAGMRYVNVPMNGVTAPTDEQVSKVLALLENASPASPVFVHCRRGADRTGTVIACYRMAHDQWRRDRALQEADSYGMSRIEIGMRRYIANFQPPVEAAAAEVGQGAANRP